MAAPVAAPVSSTKASPEEFLAPVALFQLLFAITPAISELAMGTSDPTKSMLIVLLKPEADEETFNVTVAVCTSAPQLAEIVSVELPTGVLPDVVTVIDDVPEELTVAGEKAAVAPEGKPLTLNETFPANPVLGTTVTP